MKVLLVTMSLLLSTTSWAFVSGPTSANPGQTYLIFDFQQERGKIEPNENRSSYQNAMIDIQKLKIGYGFDSYGLLSDITVYAEYGQFTSGKEAVGSTLFYEKDSGNYLTLGLSASLVHEVDRLFGVYLQLSPTRNYDEKKFSNPRLDTYAFGFTTGFNITEDVFHKGLLHIGSGDGKDQNSYLAVETGLGLRLEKWLKYKLTANYSLFLEADTNQRTDASYDNAFSPSGTTDRIRAFKYGSVLGLSYELNSSLAVNLSSLSKLGGYDARSTKIQNISLVWKF